MPLDLKNKKEITAAWKAANPDKVKLHRATHYAKCKERVLRLANDYYLKNRERILGYKKEWAAENSDAMKKAYRKHYEANKSQYFARAKAWNKNNRGVVNAALARRRALQHRATPAWANEFFISEAYHLAALRTKLLGYPWHVDHIVPLRSKQVCGLHVHDNLQVIPAAQNRSKSNRYWPDMPGTPSVKGGDMELSQCRI